MFSSGGSVSKSFLNFQLGDSFGLEPLSLGDVFCMPLDIIFSISLNKILVS